MMLLSNQLLSNHTMGGAPFATALGFETSASGMASFASGWGTSASGRYSVATGADAVASGLAASALGFMTKAESQAETVVGRYNALASSPSAGSWVDTDAIFRIGIGVSNDYRRDALTVYKNGTVVIGGDIIATNFVSPPSPPLTPLSPAPPSCCPSTTDAEERYAILEQKLAALESAQAEERAATEKKLAMLEASVAALLHGDGTSAAVPGRCGQATDVDANRLCGYRALA